MLIGWWRLRCLKTSEYMIDNCLEFSSVATEPAELYLQVQEEDPETIYYYLAEPNIDMGEVDELGFRYLFTAIVNHGEMRHPQRLRRWQEDFDDVLHEIPAEERRATPPASISEAPAYRVHPRSSYLLWTRPLILSGDEGAVLSFHSTSSSSDGSVHDSHEHLSTMETPTRRSGSTKRKRTSTQGTTGSDTRREYCTQTCLLGLKRQRSLDPACPNVDRHRQRSGARFHDLHMRAFHRRLQAQLVADMDHNCEPLGKQGARGALFKITLASHGYTFVGKGTVEAFNPDLCHEGQVYKRLKAVQGSAVPVCLGNMDLQRTYYLDVGVRIVHMLYIAWGGENMY